MKNIEKNDAERVERAPRFRVLDAVIVLLIVTAVIGIYFRYNILDALTAEKNLKEYTVSFSVDDVRHTTENYLHVNDTVYFDENGEILGTLLTAFENGNRVWSTKPTWKFFVDDEGAIQKVDYPNSESRVNAEGRLLCKGSYSEDGGFLVNGSRYLSAGQTIAVYTELVSISITILNIEAVE